MADLTIKTTQTKKPISTTLMATAGAIAGAGARYVLPTRKEMASMLNKEAKDTFVSSTKAIARANNRSVLKYCGVGALIAGGAALIAKAFRPEKKEEVSDIQYSKYQAILDSSDYACQIMWWGD